MFHAEKLFMLIRSWGPEVVFHAKTIFPAYWLPGPKSCHIRFKKNLLIVIQTPNQVIFALKNTRQLIFARKTSKTDKNVFRNFLNKNISHRHILLSIPSTSTSTKVVSSGVGSVTYADHMMSIDSFVC